MRTTERFAVAIAALSFFVSTLDTGIVNVALPEIARSLHVDASTVAANVSAYAAGLSATILFFGWLGDRVGAVRISIAGFAIFGAFSVACAVSPNVTMLVAFRALTGVGAAMLQATAASFVPRFVEGPRRARAFGLVSSILSLGPVLGPSIGGVMVSFTSWRWIFPVVIPACVAGLMCAYKLRNAKTIVVDEDARKTQQIHGWRRALPFVSAAALGATFIAVFVVSPFELKREAGLAPWLIGVVLLSTPLAASIAARFAGNTLSRGYGPYAIAGGLALCGIAACALLRIPGSQVVEFAALLAVFGAGSGAMQTPTIALSLASFPSKRQAAAGAMQRFVQNLAIAGAAQFSGLLIDRSGTASVWIFTAVVAFAGMLLTLPLIGTVRPARLQAERTETDGVDGNNRKAQHCRQHGDGQAVAD